MKAKRLFAGLVAALCLLAAGCGEAGSGAASGSSPTSGSGAVESDVAYIQEKGTLVVGITEFAPMDYKDENGNWIGFDADMAKIVAQRLGVQIEFTVIDWDNKVWHCPKVLIKGIHQYPYGTMNELEYGMNGFKRRFSSTQTR